MEALTSLGSTLAKDAPMIGKVGTGATGIMGLISNIIGGNRQNEIAKQAMDQEKQLSAIASNPGAIAQRVNAIKQPLSTGMMESVGNDVQAQLATRGLGSSPAQATQIMSQSLAPYEQHNYDTALQAVMQLLGLPMDALKTASAVNTKPTDTSALWKMFLPKDNASSAAPGLTLPTGAGGPNGDTPMMPPTSDNPFSGGDGSFDA